MLRLRSDPMDNLPQGTSDYDLYRMNVVADSAVSSLLAQRIEQGIGRGTRGGGDYCAVVLVGSKLVGWIGRKSNLAFLTASTRVQLAMGQEMSQAVTTPKEVGETIMECLKRDADWVCKPADAKAGPPNHRNHTAAKSGRLRGAGAVWRCDQRCTALSRLRRMPFADTRPEYDRAKPRRRLGTESRKAAVSFSGLTSWENNAFSLPLGSIR